MLPRANSCIHAHRRNVNPRHKSRVEYSRTVFWMVKCRWDVETVATPVTMTFVIPRWRCPYCDTFQEMGTWPVWKTISAIPQQTVIKPLRNRRPKPQSIPESVCGAVASESQMREREGGSSGSCSQYESLTDIEAGARHLRHHARPAISASHLLYYEVFNAKSCYAYDGFALDLALCCHATCRLNSPRCTHAEIYREFSCFGPRHCWRPHVTCR